MFVFEAFLFFVLNYLKYLLFFGYFYFSGRSINLIISKFYKNRNESVILKIRKEIIYPILGLIFIGNLLILLNYFIELKNNLILIILIISLMPNLSDLRFKYSFNNYNLIYFFVIPSILIISISDITFHYDAGYYHLNHQNWLRESNLIIGMVNIFWPFGMSSIFEFLSAVLWVDNSFILLHFLNLIFIHFLYNFLFFFLFVSKDRVLKNCSIFILIFSFLDNFGLGGGRNGYIYIQEVGKQDTAVAILTIFLSLILLKQIYEKSAESIDLVYAMLIAFFTFQIKVSGVFIFLLLLLNLLQLLFNKSHGLTNILYLSIPTLLISFLWFTKSFLTTGCLIFPVSTTCNKNLKWYEPGSTERIESYTTETSFAFMEYFLSKDLSFINWFQDFFGLISENGFATFYRNVYSNFLFSILFLIIVKYLFFQKKENSITFNLILFAYLFTGLSYLVFYGPIPRYTTGILTIFAGIIGFFVKNYKYKISDKLLLVIFIFSIGLVPRLNSYKSFLFNSEIVLEANKNNIGKDIDELQIWTKPETGDRCWIDISCSMNKENVKFVDNFIFKTAFKIYD